MALDEFFAEARRLNCRMVSDDPAEVRAALDAKDAEIANLREALRRLREWGGIAGKNYSATVAFDVAAWLDAGGNGPLPEAPEYARIKPSPKPPADPPAA